MTPPDDGRPGGVEGVRAVFAVPEDVDLPDDVARMAGARAAPDGAEDGDPGPMPDAEGEGMEPDYGAPPPPDGVEPTDPDRLREAAGFDRNDLGNAKRFRLHFGADVIHVPRVGWHVWDGMRWQKDTDLIAVRAKAQELSRLVREEVPFIVLGPGDMGRIGKIEALKDALAALQAREVAMGREFPAEDAAELGKTRVALREALELRDMLSKLRGAHVTFARSTGNTAKIAAALTEAEVALAVPVEALDTQPLDINTQSGVLQFRVVRGDGASPVAGVELVPHDRAQRHTKVLATVYDPEATAPRFEAFLDRIVPDRMMQGFLQRWFGYSATALTGEQALAFFYGMGANGKSVLVDLIARILGDYAATAKIESLTGQNRRSGAEATPDLMGLIGARLVRASEPEKGVQWQEGLIKQLTGGEPILVRELNMPFVEVVPDFKLTISGNDKPDIRGTDDGIWRRLMIVPFEVQIPEAERVPKAELDALLFEEAPGVLNWLVRGVLDYLEVGLMRPAEVSAATAELRRESDPYGEFLDEACLVTGEPADSMTSRTLMLAFQFWQMAKGFTPYKERTISLAMKDHSRRWRSAKTGKRFSARNANGWNGYDGIRLTDVFRRQFDAAPKDQSGKPLAVPEASQGPSQADVWGGDDAF